VFTVTNPAFLRINVGNAAMETLFIFNIISDVLVIMTIKTHHTLFTLVEKFVAILAIYLKLGVRLGKLARHQGVLHGVHHIVGISNIYAKHQHHGHNNSKAILLGC